MVNKTIYSATKIYELTSASIRTSTTSGVVHVMWGSPPSIFRQYTLYRKHLLVHAYKVPYHNEHTDFWCQEVCGHAQSTAILQRTRHPCSVCGFDRKRTLKRRAALG